MDTIYLIYFLIASIIVMIGFAIYLISIKNREISSKTKELNEKNETISKLEAFLENYKENIKEQKEELTKKEEQITTLQKEIKDAQVTIATLKTTLQEQQKNMKERLELLEKSKEEMTKEFKLIAQRVLEENSKKFEEKSTLGIKQIITPVKSQIEEFRKRVDDIYDKESKDRYALINEIKTLKELNEKMSKEAINLTNALKGHSKSQGIWGEMILQRVLESSGLREGHEYEREVSLKSEDGERYRPDVIVKLPQDRHIIIDAKTSLSDYERYVSCEDEDQKKIYLKQHINSIKEHIKELSRKDYEKLLEINSLDFIFMFVPIEGALLVALESDPTLYDKAFREHIVLVSPTTLLVALRAVENSWRYEKQAQNIKEVTNKAEKLYTKFVNFLRDFENIGKNLKRADESYNEALKKLSTGRGNIIRQITLFKDKANISPKQEIPQQLIDSSMAE